MQKFRQLVCNYSKQIKEGNIMAYNNLIRANDPMAINMLKENLAHFENNIAYIVEKYAYNGNIVAELWKMKEEALKEEVNS